MKSSTFNFTIPLDNEKYLLINTLSGAVDVVENSGYTGEALLPEDSDNDTLSYLRDRGYMLDDEVEELTSLKHIYKELLCYHRTHSPPKFVFILTFNCNLHCIYCWQRKQPKKEEHGKQTMDIITAEKAIIAVKKIQEEIVNNNLPPVIQLFGGEPLLPENAAVIKHILDSCNRNAWHTQITTNGSFLPHFIELIHTYKVGEVQVTIDGTEVTHEKRRVGSSYKNLMNSIDLLLHNGVTYVKLRVNVDLSNVDDLPSLADEIIDRQWCSNRRIYLYIAPLRDFGSESFPLIRSREELLLRLQELIDKEPKVRIFDFQGWGPYNAALSYQRTGRLPFPRPHVCEASLNQFAFDPDGNIYVCPEEAGNPESRVGQFMPDVQWDETSFSSWYNRDPLDLVQCKGCPILPICGGGCQLWIKRNRIYKDYCQAAKASFKVGMIRTLDESKQS